MYRERVNEKLPTEYLLHEFDELISCKSLGSYNCCEMVSIYLCQREKEMPDNVYTIFVFETRPNVEKSSERLLKKLKSITDTYSLGIQRKVLDVSEVRSIFELLCNSRDKKEVDIGDGRLETGYLEGVSKVFIQQDSTKEMLLNKVLKNNFINGSYILEFFDCDKKIVNVLNTVQFRKMTDTIFDAIPIDLFSVSDRIGNFVFQFPSTNVRVSYKKDDMERQLTYDVSFDKECESDDQFLVLSEGVFDDSIISFGTRTFKQEGCNTTFEVGDASRFCRTTIIDVKRQLILSRQETCLPLPTNPVRAVSKVQFIFSMLLFLLTYLCSYHLACTVVGYSCPPGTFLIAFSDLLKGEFTIYPQMKYFPVGFRYQFCIAFEIPNCLILHDLIQYCRGCILHGILHYF